MGHCGSMKNKEQLEKQLITYFKDSVKEDLPMTKEEADNLFSDEDHRQMIMLEIKEFSAANHSPTASDGRR